MEIHTADYGDSQVGADVVLAFLVELSGDQASGRSQPALAQTASVLLREKAVAALLAENAGDATGVAVLNPCASLYAGRFAEIAEVCVTPDLRSAGIGRKLLEAVVGTARASS